MKKFKLLAPVEGKVIPVAGDGKTHKVEVVLG